MRDCYLVARTCDNEVGVAISIRDPYTSPFTSRCKFARCLLLVRCLCSETVAIGFLSSVEPNFVERTALGSLKWRRSYSRWVNDAITSERSVLRKNPFLYFMPVSRWSRWYCFCTPDCARCQNRENTHTDRHTDRQNEYCNPRACAPRVNEKHWSANPRHNLTERWTDWYETELYQTTSKVRGIYIYRAWFQHRLHWCMYIYSKRLISNKTA